MVKRKKVMALVLEEKMVVYDSMGHNLLECLVFYNFLALDQEYTNRL